MRRTKEEALETRNSILCAALDVFCAKPYSKVSMSEIADAVNMTKGAIYWHFKTKDELFIQLMRSIDEQARESLPALLDGVNTMADLRSYYQELIVGPDDKELYVKVKKLLLRMNEWPKDVRLALWDLRRASLEQEKQFVAHVLRKELKNGNINANIEPDAVAEAIVAVFTGIGNLRFMEMLRKDFSKHIDFLFNAIERELKSGNFPPVANQQDE